MLEGEVYMAQMLDRQFLIGRTKGWARNLHPYGVGNCVENGLSCFSYISGRSIVVLKLFALCFLFSFNSYLSLPGRG